jgi:hypothetical protein
MHKVKEERIESLVRKPEQVEPLGRRERIM